MSYMYVIQFLFLLIIYFFFFFFSCWVCHHLTLALVSFLSHQPSSSPSLHSRFNLLRDIC